MDDGVLSNGMLTIYGPGLLLLAGVSAIALTRRWLTRRVPGLYVWGVGGLVLLGGARIALPAWVNRRILGQVVHEDGRPAQGTRIVLQRPTGVRMARVVDERGAFEFALPARDPEAHALLICPRDGEPLQLRRLPRNAVGRVRFTVWPLRPVAPGEVRLLRARCAETEEIAAGS